MTAQLNPCCQSSKEREVGAASSRNNKEGHIVTFQLAEQAFYLVFTLAFFQMVTIHSDSIIWGHTRQSTSQTHL
jgi:hypothetical protein